MNKTIFLTLTFLFSFIVNLVAQKEIYFDKAPEDSVKVKSLHGFDFGYSNAIDYSDIVRANNSESRFRNFVRNETQFNYWGEISLGSYTSMILKAGAQMAFYNYTPGFGRQIYTQDSLGNLINITPEAIWSKKLSLGAHITVETRWYLGFKKRFYKGKALLNQGWYFSLPVEIVGGNYYESFSSDTSPKTIINKYITPTIGYRKAITNHLLIEGALGIVVDPFTSANEGMLGLASSIKIGYAF
jgi:hypothetical protein